jgi:hypothetical protein
MKLIDKDALVAEIENIESSALCEYNSNKSRYDEGSLDVVHRIKYFLNTLEVKEVDFKKEMEEYLSIYWPNEKDLHPFLGHVAKYFFELGLSHSIDESIVRKIIDLYFEASKHYGEVIKQERYRTGGSQLAIDILSGSKDMKELCVQYVLDKVTKE